ncbi:hypothetical protein ACSZOO_23830, partial [Aeromonas hydrophila]
TIKLTAYHRPISICFVGKKLFLIFNKMFTISPWAKVQADIKRMCPWVPIKVVECNNALPCSKAELKRVMELHNRCNDSLRRILACTASGVPVDVCKQSL